MRYEKLVSILKCPITNSDLSWATQDELTALSLGTEPHVGRIEAAFKTVDGNIFYPIIDDIIYLLPDLALGDNAALHPRSDNTKQSVREFYDKFGWQQEAGVFQDAKDSEDLRQVSADYVLNCHLRLNRHLPKQGKYLLDVASGPIQYPAYLSYSEHYEYRICGDISLRALQAAKQKLGDKGIYLLCDVTQLPIKDNCIDAIVSLHTLYHVPREQQLKAFAEINRTLQPGGVSAIVYSWGGHSLLMKLLMLPQKAYGWFKRRLQNPSTEQTLYFYAHPYSWYVKELKDKYQTQLYAWRSVNVPFLQNYIHRLLGGKQILKAIYALEEKFPQLLGKLGAYPLFVSKKNP